MCPKSTVMGKAFPVDLVNIDLQDHKLQVGVRYGETVRQQVITSDAQSPHVHGSAVTLPSDLLRCLVKKEKKRKVLIVCFSHVVQRIPYDALSSLIVPLP